MAPSTKSSCKLDSASPALSPTTKSCKPTTQVLTDLELRQLLGIQLPDQDGKLHCHGRGKTHAECRCPINIQNRKLIVEKLGKLAVAWCHSPSSLQMLKELSHLVLCLRFHQDQASDKFDSWKSKMPLKRPTTHSGDSDSKKDLTTHNKSVPAISQASHPQSTPSPRDYDLEHPCRSKIHLTTSRSHTTRRDIVVEEPVKRELKTRRETKGSKQCSTYPSRSSTPTTELSLDKSEKQPRSTRSCPNPALSRTNEGYQFEHMGRDKCPEVAVEDLKKKIKENISPTEFKSGFIYGFRRAGCDLIKIGVTTVSVDNRMHSIATKCNYAPIVVFQIPTRNAMKVERLVHKQLYKERRRECLQEGLCNGGKGCSTRHYEWFEGVSDERAQSVVQTWVDWIRCEPYTEKGILKPKWVEVIDSFRWGPSKNFDVSLQNCLNIEHWSDKRPKNECDSKAIKVKQEVVVKVEAGIKIKAEFSVDSISTLYNQPSVRKMASTILRSQVKIELPCFRRSAVSTGS